jgi:hypothetical protein
MLLLLMVHRNYKSTFMRQQKLRLLGSGVVVADGSQELEINFYVSTETKATWFWCCCC